jgi:hypothetical protein
MPLAVLLVLSAAVGGCRSANWKPTFVASLSGGDSKAVYVWLRPADQFTIDDLEGDRLVVENLFGWNDQGTPVQARWVRHDSKMGWMLEVAADTPQPARWIEVQGTVAHKSMRVRDVFRARWEMPTGGGAPASGGWRLVNFSDNVELVAPPPPAKGAAPGKAGAAESKGAAEFKVAEPSKAGGKAAGS